MNGAMDFIPWYLSQFFTVVFCLCILFLMFCFSIIFVLEKYESFRSMYFVIMISIAGDFDYLGFRLELTEEVFVVCS